MNPQVSRAGSEDQLNFGVGALNEPRQAGDEDGDSSESSDSSSSSDSQSDVLSEDDYVEGSAFLGVPTPPEGYSFVQHRRSKTLHFLKDGYKRVLVCGRMVTDAYAKPRRDAIRFDTSRCHNCLRAHRGTVNDE